MAVNSVQTGLRLPLTGLAPPRLLMCSASMGAEGSVTLQLREAVQAPISESTTINNALTIGYPDPEILADVLGTFQAAGSDGTYDIVTSRQQQSAQFFKTTNNITTIKQETVAKVIETSSLHSQKGSASISSTPPTSVASIVVSTQQPITMTTLATPATISSHLPQTNSSLTTTPTAQTTTQTIKKSRPKTASPTRHGPQQCQVCSKVFGNASALAKHKLTHSDERKYVCGMCSKAFKRQDHLNGHMLTHRNKKPYECKAEGCGKSYCDARSLRRHTENHHSSLVLATTSTTTSSSQNQSNSVSSNNVSSGTSTITNPSLSPATASGDASSPHGATCIQYQMNSDGNTITAINSKSPSPSSPAGTSNEGLTRQQLDLISQIMQQTKQANGQKSSASRPRTWNMQLQAQNHGKTTTIDAAVKSNTHQTPTSSATNSQQTQKNHGANGGEQKPVECNLCHRKFKNIPALNGHMRLHGGYFKKDTDTKKSDKKESSGPPLQTASVGVRALIEEKIINKRSKDLKGTAFVVPAAPLSTTRRLAEAEAFLNAKNVGTLSNTNNNTITIVASGITSNTLNGLAKHTIVQQVSHQQATTNVVQKTTQISTLSSEKDATLIELLKRGTTKVAVKRACTDSSASSNNIQTTRVVVPTTISASETVSDSPSTSLVLASNGSSSPLSLTISQAPSTSGSSGDIYALTYSANSSPSFLSDSDVYSVNDTAMLLQAVDSIQLLQDNSTSDQLDDIASLSDYTSLSDSVSLNQSFTPSRQLQAVLDSPLPDSLVEFGTLNSKDYVLYGCSNSNGSPSSNSPLPSPLAYPTPPASHETIAQASPFLDDSHHFSDVSTFFHDDKKTNMKNNNNSSSSNNSNSSSNNNANDDFGLLDDSSELFHNMKHTKDNSNLTESERILQLKNELFNDSKVVLEEFRNKSNSSNISGSTNNNNKSILDEHDLFKHDNSFLNNDSKTFIGDNSAKLQDFNQNLDFLDEAQAFNIVDDDRVNTSSPLSAAFFSSMSTAEEVKEALEEVLPNEDDGAGSTLDLYFLSAGLSLQSQMMSNSDDPLLSSVPRDFGHQRCQTNQSVTSTSISSSASSSLKNSHETPNFDIDPFSPPESKKIKIECHHHNSPIVISSDNSDKNLLSVQTEQILTKDNIGSVFLSPNSISSSSSGSSPKILQSALLSDRKKFCSFNNNNNNNNYNIDNKNEQYEKIVKKSEQFKSKMKRISQLHYTPSPLLNPERYGIGLYLSSIPMDHLNHDFDNDEIDTIDFFEKPRVNIGTDYQATLPPDISYTNNNNNYNSSNSKYEDKKIHETLLWKPNVLEDDRQLDRYIDLVKSSAVPTHSIESALRILMESQGEVHVAVLKLLQGSDKSIEKRWSQTEMEQFLKGLEKHGKDFTSIARDILNKTTGDCVQLYYFWKKLCNEYKSTHLPQQQQHSSRDCSSMIGNDNQHNCDDFFDYVENNNNNNNNLSNPTIQNGNGIGQNNNNSTVVAHNNELRPHVCEVPDCSASFSSRVALHGHTRIHCIGRSMNQLNNGNLLNNSNQAGTSLKDDFSFPCKVCGKVFNKVKSRSAHMKSHRPQESEIQQ